MRPRLPDAGHDSESSGWTRVWGLWALQRLHRTQHCPSASASSAARSPVAPLLENERWLNVDNSTVLPRRSAEPDLVAAPLPRQCLCHHDRQPGHTLFLFVLWLSARKTCMCVSMHHCTRVLAPTHARALKSYLERAWGPYVALVCLCMCMHACMCVYICCLLFIA